MSEKASKLLNTIGSFDIVTKQVVEMVEAIFHVEDLFTLARNNSFIALNFFQLLANIDYVLFVGMCHDMKQKITPVGGTNLGAELGSIITGVGGASFDNNLEGVLLAISNCFKIQAAKMDANIDVYMLSAFAQGTGMAQVAQDAVNAFLGASREVVNVGTKAVMAGALDGGYPQAMGSIDERVSKLEYKGTGKISKKQMKRYRGE
jgi:hypothetical protein